MTRCSDCRPADNEGYRYPREQVDALAEVLVSQMTDRTYDHEAAYLFQRDPRDFAQAVMDAGWVPRAEVDSLRVTLAAVSVSLNDFLDGIPVYGPVDGTGRPDPRGVMMLDISRDGFRDVIRTILSSADPVSLADVREGKPCGEGRTR